MSQTTNRREGTAPCARLVFITGTGTGTGKTVFTGLMLAHLRARGLDALAVKPFCSGSRSDVELLRELQNGNLPSEEMNPFWYREPLAPSAAARLHKDRVQLSQAVGHVQRVAKKCELLLIEGIGGLLVPCGEKFTVLDLICALRAEVIVVAQNELGTINHTLLTVRALRSRRIRPLAVALMTRARPDVSAQSNPAMIREWLGSVPIVQIPWLGRGAGKKVAIRRSATRLARTLERILRS